MLVDVHGGPDRAGDGAVGRLVAVLHEPGMGGAPPEPTWIDGDGRDFVQAAAAMGRGGRRGRRGRDQGGGPGLV